MRIPCCKSTGWRLAPPSPATRPSGILCMLRMYPSSVFTYIQIKLLIIINLNLNKLIYHLKLLTLITVRSDH